MRSRISEAEAQKGGGYILNHAFFGRGLTPTLQRNHFFLRNHHHFTTEWHMALFDVLASVPMETFAAQIAQKSKLVVESAS